METNIQEVGWTAGNTLKNGKGRDIYNSGDIYEGEYK
jgi:hypothetical protein